MVTWRRVYWLMVLVGFLLAAPAWAQQQAGGIRGVVYDKEFNVPLAGVKVSIAEIPGASVTANDAGNYVFPQVVPGTYTLVFTKDGYVRQVKAEVTVAENQLSDVDVSLSGEITEMDEFVVKELAPFDSESILGEQRAKAPAFLNSISSDLMKQAGASDAGAALKLVAGTSVQDGKFAVVRGLPDRYVNSQLNGVRLPSADDKTRAVELDLFPAAVIDNIQVSKTFTPDQQGDASGGAVNVVLKGIPDETFIQFSSSVEYNTNTTGRKDFLTYKGGGVSYFGFDDGQRELQNEWNSPPKSLVPTSPNDGFYNGAAGISREDAPLDYKYQLTFGGKHEVSDGVKIGVLMSFFYEQDTSGFQNGVDNEYVYSPRTKRLVPQKSIERSDEDYFTSLYDVDQDSVEAKWGGLGVVGLETKEHELKFTEFYSRSAEDTVTLAEDTRGKQYFFPGYNPNKPSSPGFDLPNAAPYTRTESLSYNERTTQSTQFSGRHKLPFFEGEDKSEGHGMSLLKPEVDWIVALNKATFEEPDKRLFGSVWKPDPGSHGPLLPGNNVNLGNFQRIFRDITEEGVQYQLNLKLPFKQWTDTEGYLKAGVFSDHVERQYNQDTFSNPASTDGGQGHIGDFDDLWSRVFPSQRHFTVASIFDTNYSGEFDVEAAYGMAELPLTSFFKLIGGARFESTAISTVVDPDRDPGTGEFGPVFYPPNSQVGVKVDPRFVNVDFQQDDVLPSIGFAWDLIEPLTLRASYSETVARQTFRELTPIQQQEYLGGPVFVGNPELRMAALKNYDLRLDYKPMAGSLLSGSYFFKDITDPIEYINQATADSGNFTTPVNYPKGELSGFEFEVRQEMGGLWEPLRGLTLGGNATLIDSEVTVPDSEIAAIRAVGGPRISSTRDATNAPELLYNIFGIYTIERTGTEFAVFYTVHGDTLVAGGGAGAKGFIPDVYEKEYGTLNVSISQKIGKYVKLTFQAKNLTDPEIQEVYRGNFVGGDVLKTSYTKGIDLSLGISARFEF